MGRKGESVSIGRLERFVADLEHEKGITVEPAKIGMAERVAVVGAGPAGLTVAADLANLGYSVVVFEALHVAGGVLVYGIPEFRLPKRIVQAEVDYIKRLGVELQTDSLIGRLYTVQELLSQGFRRYLHRHRRRLTKIHGHPRRKPLRNLLSQRISNTRQPHEIL